MTVRTIRKLIVFFAVITLIMSGLTFYRFTKKETPSTNSPAQDEKLTQVNPAGDQKADSPQPLKVSKIPVLNEDQILTEARKKLEELTIEKPFEFSSFSDLLMFSPGEAIEWILTKPPEGCYERAYEIAGDHFGKLGRNEVNRILQKLNPKQAFFFIRGAVEGLAVQSPMQALELKNRFEESTGEVLKADDYMLYSNAVFGGKFEEALFAVQTYIPEPKKTRDLGQLFGYLARTEPEKAVNDLVSTSFSEKTEANVLDTLLRQWSSRTQAGGDPARLKRWMKTLDPERLQLVQQSLQRIHAK